MRIEKEARVKAVATLRSQGMIIRDDSPAVTGNLENGTKTGDPPSEEVTPEQVQGLAVEQEAPGGEEPTREESKKESKKEAVEDSMVPKPGAKTDSSAGAGGGSASNEATSKGMRTAAASSEGSDSVSSSSSSSMRGGPQGLPARKGAADGDANLLKPSYSNGNR